MALTWDGVGVRGVVPHQHLGHHGVWDLEGLVVWRLELADRLLPIPEGPPAGAGSRSEQPGEAGRARHTPGAPAGLAAAPFLGTTALLQPLRKGSCPQHVLAARWRLGEMPHSQEGHLYGRVHQHVGGQ